MKFPTKGIVAGVVAAVFLWLFGFPPWAAALFGSMAFLGMGGLPYVRLVIKTFPKDLWMARRLIKVLLGLKRMKTEKLYISDLFQEVVAKYPNKIAIMFEDQTLTFRELDELSNKIANLFLSAGFQHRDCVALFMENCPEYLIVLLGLSKIGVTVAFVNCNLRHEALTHCIKISNCRSIVFSASLSNAISDVLGDLDHTVKDNCYYMCGESSVMEAKNLDEEVKTASASNPPPVPGKLDTDNVCYIYTSGTTGLPKACKVKHSRFFGLQCGVHTFAKITPDDTIYCCLPLYHTNGGVLSSGQMLFYGSTLVIRKKFSASNFWTDCIKYKCTVTFYIGEVCRYILSQPSKPTDTQHGVRLILGNGLRHQIWKDFQDRFQIPQIAEFYGSTEGNVGLINPFNKVGACGRISVLLTFLNPVTMIKVDELGEYIRNSNGFCIEAGVNEPGECVGAIRPRVASSEFSGYTDSKASSKKLMRNVFKTGDSYFLSGDVLKMDEEGFLYFCDRTGDTFRWKGENVSTTEVESMMANILKLTDVVVYGVEVPGNEGKAGMAAIVGSPESVDLSGLPQQLFLSLPPYAVPLFVRFIECAEMTGTYKLQKVKLKNEGFDTDKVSDPMYMLRGKSYVLLTEALYQEVLRGSIRV